MRDGADAHNERQPARRRALLYRGFASASTSHLRPRSSFITPQHQYAPCQFAAAGPHGATLTAVARSALPPYRFSASSPLERPYAVERASTPLTKAAVGGGGGGYAKPAVALPPKEYAPPPFKGLASAFGAKALILTVVKSYALSFGNTMFTADLEDSAITDEQITAAHKAAVELIAREVATVTLRRCLEKAAILALERRWSTKLLKDVGSSAKRKAAREGRFFAAGRVALTALRSSFLVHIATWAVEAAIDLLAYARGRMSARACARTVLHRAINRLICAVAGALGASVATLLLPGIGTFIGALLAESAGPYLTVAMFGEVGTFAA